MSDLQARVEQAVDQLVESGAERGMLAVVSGPAPLGLTSCCNKVSNYQARSWGSAGHVPRRARRLMSPGDVRSAVARAGRLPRLVFPDERRPEREQYRRWWRANSEEVRAKARDYRTQHREEYNRRRAKSIGIRTADPPPRVRELANLQ